LPRSLVLSYPTMLGWEPWQPAWFPWHLHKTEVYQRLTASYRYDNLPTAHCTHKKKYSVLLVTVTHIMIPTQTWSMKAWWWTLPSSYNCMLGYILHNNWFSFILHSLPSRLITLGCLPNFPKFFLWLVNCSGPSTQKSGTLVQCLTVFPHFPTVIGE